MIKKIALFAIIITLTSCGGARVKTFTGYPVPPEITHLEGIKQTVFVGDAMTSSAPMIVIETITLKNKLTAATTHKDKPKELLAGPGAYTLVRQSSLGKFYESSTYSFELNGRVTPGGLFLPSQSTLSPALYWGSISASLAPGRPIAMFMADLDVSPEITLSKSKQPPNIFQGFVSTLTYTGVAAGQIKFVYREFNDGLARAAFTQEVSLDYAAGKTYSYKSARFVVHEATTSEISFTLLQSL